MKRPPSTTIWATRQRVSCRRVVWASLGPFFLAAIVGSLVFRATRGSGSGLQEAVVQRHPARVLEETLPCLGSNCELQGGSSLTVLGGADGSSSSGGGGGAPSAAAAGSAAAVSGAAGQRGASTAPGDLPKLFLFIGILSGRGYRHRRLAVREAWSNRAQIPGQVVSKFILSEDERTPQVEKELDAYGDIVFVREKTNYKSILFKTFYVLEYASQNYDAAFVLKTDDDAFINVPPMVAQLRALCENPGCVNERVYMGRMAKHSEVLLQPGHKWNNMAFHNHTGLKEYPNYMMGGGYVMGGEVARVLVDVHSRMHLKFTPIEDATLGFWLMAMDLRHIDHPMFYTWAAPCCFKAPIRKPGERFVSRFQLTDEFEANICSTDPWLVLHKIDSPTKMRFVGSRVGNCTAPEPHILPASILQYFSQETRQRWQEERVAYLRAHGRPMDSPPPPPPSPSPPPPPNNSTAAKAGATPGTAAGTAAHTAATSTAASTAGASAAGVAANAAAANTAGLVGAAAAGAAAGAAGAASGTTAGAAAGAAAGIGAADTGGTASTAGSVAAGSGSSAGSAAGSSSGGGTVGGSGNALGGSTLEGSEVEGAGALADPRIAAGGGLADPRVVAGADGVTADAAAGSGAGAILSQAEAAARAAAGGTAL